MVATPGQPQAMQDAAEALELDAALIWPLCRETFSFTAYEAAAAGAAVITGPDSGNEDWKPNQNTCRCSTGDWAE